MLLSSGRHKNGAPQYCDALLRGLVSMSDAYTRPSEMKRMASEFIQTDCIKKLVELPDQSIDVLITDPPYPNQQGLFTDTICDGYAGLYLGAKKTKKYVVFFWSPRHLPPTPPTGFFEVARHVWAKPDARSNTAYENIIVWARGDYKRQNSRVWTVPILDYRTLADWQPHPTQKPLRLMRYLVETYAREGERVLDPFAGSGTTALACLQLHREYLAIEIDPKYAEAAKNRLAQKALREYNTAEEPATTENQHSTPPHDTGENKKTKPAPKK